MNKTLIKIFVIVGFFSAILGLVFSFLPISNLAIFPAIVGLVLSVTAYLSLKKQNLSFSFAKIVIALSVIAILISVGKNFFIDNKVAEDTTFIEKSEESEKEAVKDLQELEELNELEDIEEELNEVDELDDIEEIGQVEKSSGFKKAEEVKEINDIEDLDDLEDLE